MAANLAAQLIASQNQVAAPRPGGQDQLQGPKIVPKTPELSKLLGLAPDIFSVHRVELVRKATDELAFGLSWYVLYTMTHSAFDTNGKANPIHFKSGDYEMDVDGNITRKMDKLQIEVKQSDLKRDLVDSWQTYMNQFSRLDVRSLLNHIVRVNDSHTRKCCEGSRYYGDGVPAQASLVKDYIRFFIHRNGVVGDKNHTAVERNKDVANALFEQLEPLVQLMKGSVNLDTQQWQWWHNPCKEALDAAHQHFKSALNIRKLYKRLFQDYRRLDLTAHNALVDIQKQHTHASGDKKRLWAQCIMFSFWTRFGIINTLPNADPNNAEEDDPCDQGFDPQISKPSKHMTMVEVKRYSINTEWKGQASGKKLVSAESTFLADPIGITHLDVYNRALDVASLCLRRILIDAVVREEADAVAQTVNVSAVRVALLELKVPALCVDREEGSATVFKEVKLPDNTGTLADFICDRNQDVDWSNITSYMLQNDPHFADPRFLANFMDRVITSSGLKVFPDASFMVTILDSASHQSHLHVSKKLNRNDLSQNLGRLLHLINGVAERVTVAPQEMTEYKAFAEMMNVFLPFYRRWRSRQHIAQRMDEDTFERRAKQTMQGLVDVCQPNLPIRAPYQGAPVDGSAEALSHILRLTCQDQVAPRPGRLAQNQVLARRPANVFTLLFDFPTDDE